MSEEHCVAGRAADHGEHGQPHVGQRLWREAAVADAQHVGHRLEQRPRVLLKPVGLLEREGWCFNRSAITIYNRSVSIIGKKHFFFFFFKK